MSRKTPVGRWGTVTFPLVLALLLLIAQFNVGTKPNSGWAQVEKILNRIVPPTFPEKDFLITQYGAVGDGETDCTEAFKKAITACHEAGGGRVVVPEGVYLTGAIHLRSNVNLHVTKNAVILFSKDTRKYLPVVYTRFEGVECMNYSPFIYAYEQENLALTGSGTIDGNAGPDVWWPWKGKKEYGWKEGEPNGDRDVEKLNQMAENGVPVKERVFGEGHYLRPNFIQPYKCKNILIDSVTVKRSPMWGIHPVLCENVIVKNVTVISYGPNNDGCNPESSKNVLIKNCYFDTGDDCIAIKSGRNADGRRLNVPSENIIIQGCTMKDGHGGVVIGSEMSGSCRNIFAEDCVMDSPNLERALRIKTNSMRGGVVENIYMRNVTVGEVSDAVIWVNFNYQEGDAGQHTPIVRNLYVTNVTSKKSNYALFLAGYERSPVSNLYLENCRFDGVAKGNMLRHYRDLKMKNVYINGELQK
ncbi:MAG: glycoside hydrolase family 28 protein [candidate division KSB1 bacterium]|nr:glycoside hydrolase family 28 protein [candidate division KSB1 bacterium]MDZ7304804.1 glycoside hydrolase family 28 protein [candidate division KSB1 bacterium]MDZ7312943.1 glycoside hydrolase family 28 protein [candidate division KSB1 bacterium]